MKDSLSNSLKDFCLVFANTHSIAPVGHTGKGSPTKLRWYIWIVKVNLSCVSCFFTIKVTLYCSLYSVVPTLSLSLTRPCIDPRSYFQKRRRDTGKWLVTYSRLCILYSVLCTLYSVLCTLYSVLCTLYSVLCTHLQPAAHYELCGRDVPTLQLRQLIPHLLLGSGSSSSSSELKLALLHSGLPRGPSRAPPSQERTVRQGENYQPV